MSEPIEPHRPGVCVNFNGIQNKTCVAGVEYNLVRDSDSSPYRWPCFLQGELHSTRTACAKLLPPTAEEIAADERQTVALIERFNDDMQHNRCPHCHQQVIKKVQVGRCVYGEPCGHRMYQGRA